MVLCETQDLGCTVERPEESPGEHPGRGDGLGRIYLYDHFPGGVGFAARLFEDRRTLLVRAQTLVAACSCQRGCPACVGPVSDPQSGGKAAAIRLLGELLNLVGEEVRA